MNQDQAIKLASDLMDSHGLEEWTLEFDAALRRRGRCRKHLQTISLSLPYVLVNEEPAVRDTILHEIAHALDPYTGHGPNWVRICLEIGADPYRQVEKVSPMMPFSMICERHGKIGERGMPFTRSTACSRCCRENGVAFSMDYLLTCVANY